MIWTGLGCLLQGINSIVWDGNMINRAPIYCDICKSVHPLSLDRSLTLRRRTATRIQAALNVAIPACSLCINRRLYKIATAKAAMTTYSERRRAVIQDLLIGVGLPILQIVTRECAHCLAIHSISLSAILRVCNPEYIVSSNRYNIYEDFGPSLALVDTPPTFFLFNAWPVAIGTVSLFYCCEYPGLS